MGGETPDPIAPSGNGKMGLQKTPPGPTGRGDMRRNDGDIATIRRPDR